MTPPTDRSWPEVLTTEQAAEYLQMTALTLTRLARNGDVPSGRFGREWRFLKEELDAMMRSTRPSSPRVVPADEPPKGDDSEPRRLPTAEIPHPHDTLQAKEG